MADREPMPLCELHGDTITMTMAAARCRECGSTTNSAWVMCGDCAEQRQVCVFHGTPAVRTLRR